MKYREVVRRIENDGWRLVRQSGSHKHYAHPAKAHIITIAPHGMNADVPPGILNEILKKAGLKK